MWARKHSSCIRCNSTDWPHEAKGLCHPCYIKVVYGTKSEYRPRGLTWSRQYDACALCGRDDAPHAAMGYCRTCYVRIRYWEKRGVTREEYVSNFIPK